MAGKRIANGLSLFDRTEGSITIALLNAPSGYAFLWKKDAELLIAELQAIFELGNAGKTPVVAPPSAENGT